MWKEPWPRDGGKEFKVFLHSLRIPHGGGSTSPHFRQTA